VRISDAQLDLLPLRGHDWHGNWNYTLQPRAFERVTAPEAKPFDQASPELAWLCHPAVTGLDTIEWTALIRALGALHEDQRETALRFRRGRDRKTAASGGRRATLTLVDQVLAAELHYRLGMTQTAIAQMFGVTLGALNKRLHQMRQLFYLLGRPLERAKAQASTPADLRKLVGMPVATATQQIKTVS
jgi:hypothetical protein